MDLLIQSFSLHLASHLYSEHLLDQDHYHDWLMTSLQNSDLDNLPIWLQVVQTHRQEIIQHRRRGKRLAEATLDHIQMVSWLHNSIDIPSKYP